jgi:SAM-dependent methyltransferase
MDARTLRCPVCQWTIVPHAGLLMQGAGRASRNHETGALRLMNSPLVARVYERAWRPALVRMVSGFGYDAEDAIVDRCLQSHQHPLRILDLCCGTCRAGRRWVVRGAEVLGIDQSIAMLREARRRCEDERLLLLHADATRQFSRTNLFDAVICFGALHLLADARAAISIAAASLRSGGLFFSWVVVAAGKLRPAIFRSLITEPMGLRLFEPGSLQLMAAAAGLEVVESVTSAAIEFVVARRG